MISLHKKAPSLIILFIGLLGCFAFKPLQTVAQGNLVVYPKRIVFDDGARYKTLTLSNSGNDTARYVIAIKQIRMTREGNLETITEPDPGQHFADQNLRFFPRSVTLAPNESQTVKIQLVKSKEMEPGEYRSHIYLKAEAEKKPQGVKDPVAKATDLSITITPIFGISLPVIIKIGESTTKINISEPSFQVSEAGPSVKFNVNRTGNMSAYGDLLINHISPSGKVTKVGILRGLAVYSPIPARQMQVPLDKTGKYDAGKLQLLISAQLPATTILAEATILL